MTLAVLLIKQLLSIYMADALFKDKGERIRNNSGERMSIVSCRSKLVVYGITQCVQD